MGRDARRPAADARDRGETRAAVGTDAAGVGDAPIARLSHVTLTYEHGTTALDDVSLELRGGERVCVLGANGSGKSTLASVLAGLLAPDAGTVELAGEAVCRDGSPDLEAYRRARRSLGLVFQSPDDQIVTSVVADDVAFGPENLGVAPDEIGRRVERELRRVALLDRAQDDPARLSGGQKQRVAIAGALAMEPRLLVLDEPGALLDVRGRRSIMRVMGRLRDAGVAVVHVTHFMDEALAADRVLVLSHGRVVREGTPAEAFARPEELAGLGLEAPFAARLSARLAELGVGVPWTCDEGELARSVAGAVARGGAEPGRTGQVEPAGDGPAAAPDAGPAPRGEGDARPATPDAAPGAEPAVCVEHVSYSYAPERDGRARAALDDVSLTVPAGTSCAIVGQTGSGKSTLLRLLCGLEAPDRGRVVVGGVNTARRRDRRRLHGRVGYVMQHPERQLFAQTVLDDVAFGPGNLGLGADEVRARCERALRLVGLWDRRDASPFELSGGQRRLCAIAGILAMEPRLLLLDEPTAGLDPHGRRGLSAVLDRVRATGVTLVTVTHSMDDAARSDLVFVLDRSHVVMAGPPGRVFSAENRDALTEAGLGLPRALEFALGLEAAGVRGLGRPLGLEGLARAVARAAGTAGDGREKAAGSHGPAPSDAGRSHNGREGRVV